MAASKLKLKNDVHFTPVGNSFSIFIPDGETIHVYASIDDVNFAEVGKESTLSGPNIFQCTGFNPHTIFKVNGLSSDELELTLLY